MSADMKKQVRKRKHDVSNIPSSVLWNV